MKIILFVFGILLFPSITFANWQISRSDFEIKNSFTSTQTYELYTGDNVIDERERTPKTGFKFIIVQIQVENQNETNKHFHSKEIFLKAEGKSYQRLKDDKFLKDYNITPFTHLNLKKGIHKGSVLFEIPQNTDTSNLELLYNNKVIQKK